MARPRRTHVPGAIYLVSAIGEYGQTVFADAGDRIALGRLVADVIQRCGSRLHAFKWLDDELLMMMQVYGVSLSGVMQRITSVHARRVNEKLGQKGALFQHPHRAVLLEDAESVLQALATIHRHPIGPWTSHFAYLGCEEIAWLTTTLGLELLATTRERQIPAYRDLIAQPAPWKLEPWRIARSTRGRGSRPFDEFAAWVKSRSSERSKPATLEQLIRAVARWFQVDPAAIESTRERSALLSLARGLIVWVAMQNRIASLSELGRRFERGRSTLHETRETYRTRIPQMFNMRLSEILEGPGIAVSEVLRQAGAARRKS